MINMIFFNINMFFFYVVQPFFTDWFIKTWWIFESSSKEEGDHNTWQGHTCQSEARGKNKLTISWIAQPRTPTTLWYLSIETSNTGSVAFCWGICKKVLHQRLNQPFVCSSVVFIGLYSFVCLFWVPYKFFLEVNTNVWARHSKEAIHTRTINSIFSDQNKTKNPWPTK